MKVHATITDHAAHYEHVEGSSSTVPGLAVSVSELFRRQSLGLPMGVGVHGVTNIPEGMSFEQARAEALYYVRKNEERSSAAAAPPGAPPGPDGEPAA